MKNPQWLEIYNTAAHLECLALTAPVWGRAILFREIKVLDRFALHIIEPIESDGHKIPSFCCARFASILADLRPLAALIRPGEVDSWSSTIDHIQDAILTV